MSQLPVSDVFTVDEVARAVGVPQATVSDFVASGNLRAVRGTTFFAAAEVLWRAPALRAAAVRASPGGSSQLFSESEAFAARAKPANRVPHIASSLVHAFLFILALGVTAGTPHTAATTAPSEPSQLVFLMIPGQGGGGGGSGGEQRRRPATRLERRGTDKAISVPLATPEPSLTSRTDEPHPTPAATPVPVEPAPEPLAARTVIAPVVVTAASAREQPGVTERPAVDPASQGAGVGGRAGDGRGTGNGEGLGSGIGRGAGGGAGGGPYRPGTGIQPPRLIREVKAEYTEDARRRGLSGDVILEIVVKRDGGVGDVTVVRGLAAGLDQRAVAAVRQWQFAPARRLGEPVDVIVEVAVEFTLR